MNPAGLDIISPCGGTFCSFSILLCHVQRQCCRSSCHCNANMEQRLSFVKAGGDVLKLNSILTESTRKKVGREILQPELLLNIQGHINLSTAKNAPIYYFISRPIPTRVNLSLRCLCPNLEQYNRSVFLSRCFL